MPLPSARLLELRYCTFLKNIEKQRVSTNSYSPDTRKHFSNCLTLFENHTGVQMVANLDF
jgi:hypothetical protein